MGQELFGHLSPIGGQPDLAGAPIVGVILTSNQAASLGSINPSRNVAGALEQLSAELHRTQATLLAEGKAGQQVECRAVEGGLRYRLGLYGRFYGDLSAQECSRGRQMRH